MVSREYAVFADNGGHGDAAHRGTVNRQRRHVGVSGLRAGQGPVPEPGPVPARPTGGAPVHDADPDGGPENVPLHGESAARRSSPRRRQQPAPFLRIRRVLSDRTSGGSLLTGVSVAGPAESPAGDRVVSREGRLRGGLPGGGDDGAARRGHSGSQPGECSLLDALVLAGPASGQAERRAGCACDRPVAEPLLRGMRRPTERECGAAGFLHGVRNQPGRSQRRPLGTNCEVTQ